MSISIELLHGIIVKPLRFASPDDTVYVIGSTTHDGVKYNAVITTADDDYTPFEDYVKHPIMSVSIDTLPGEGDVLWLTDKISLERD